MGGGTYGFYIKSSILLSELHFLPVGQVDDALHLVAVKALYGERLAIPTEDESVKVTIFGGETDVVLLVNLTGARAIDAFAV